MNLEQREKFWNTDLCRICRISTGKPYLCPNCQSNMIHDLLNKLPTDLKPLEKSVKQ